MKNIKRFLLALIVTITIFPLTSCSFLGSVVSKISGETKDERGIRHLEEIMTAIEKKDRDAIKKMFSEEALENAEDIDKGIDYLFSLVEGHYVSCETLGNGLGKSIGGGKTTKLHYVFYYTVDTDFKQYNIYITDYKIDDDNPKNIGIYNIDVIISTDEEGENRKVKEPGIYFPAE